MKQQICLNKTQYFDRWPRQDQDDHTDDLYPRAQYTLANIIAFVKSKGWEDYNKITIGSNTRPRSNDTYIWIETSIPKTKKEIEKEEAVLLAEEEKKLQAKLARKQAKEERVALKAKAMSKLSVEERKALGL